MEIDCEMFERTANLHSYCKIQKKINNTVAVNKIELSPSYQGSRMPQRALKENTPTEQFDTNQLHILTVKRSNGDSKDYYILKYFWNCSSEKLKQLRRVKKNAGVDGLITIEEN